MVARCQQRQCKNERLTDNSMHEHPFKLQLHKRTYISFSLYSFTRSLSSSMILITGADQYVGHCVASHLASHRYLRSRLRLACRDKDLCLGFSNKNIDVRQIDYYHPHELSKAFRGIDHVILAVGNEHDRVAIAENICKVADRSGVKSIVCVSQVGATATEYPHLRHFASIEDNVVNTTNCDWVILR